MKRWSIPLILVIGLALVALVLLPAPKPAQASISSCSWFETTYCGFDAFYGTGVAAYETGAEAKLVAQVYNDAGVDVSINSAKVKFDWGEEYTTTNFPSQIKAGEYGLVTFEFDVPALTTATNMTTHRYEIIVVYEMQDGPAMVNWIDQEYVGLGNGVTTTFSLDFGPIVPDSQTIYFVDYTANTIATVPASAYTISNYTRQITFTTAPAAGIVIYADYKYAEYVGSGDGLNTVFYLDYKPVVPDSQTVYLVDPVAETVTSVATTGYSIDNDRGKIDFTTAPESWKYVAATYKYYRSWTYSWSDFVVYSADQADAQELNQKLEEISYVGETKEGIELAKEAGIEEGLGDIEYANGNFTAAKTYYESALAKIDQGLTTDVAKGATEAQLNKTIADSKGELTILYILGGIGAVLFGFGAVLYALTRPGR